jgi:glutathione S-transferase
MKLYYAPAACSLSPHIVAKELGLELGLVKVDTATKKTEDGRDFYTINPKGYVPVLELDNGEFLTEGPTIVQYLADLRPEAGLVPPANGSMARYRVQEMLGYINSELHKTYSPLFSPATPDVVRQDRAAYLKKRYAILDQRLEKQGYLFGDQFTAADAYLFVVTGWSKFVKLDLSEFRNLLAFQGRVAERPAVRSAMIAEGLVPAPAA